MTYSIVIAAFSSVPLLSNGTPLALVLFLVYFALFLLPGLAVAASSLRHKQLTSPLPIIVTVTASATFGLLAFWAFFLDKTLGRTFCFLIYIASAVLLVWLSRKRDIVRPFFRSVRTPFLLTALAGLLYTTLFFLPSKSVRNDLELPGFRFFTKGRPGDNLIPLFLADRFYDQRPVRPFCCGDWLSSDRPPLQSGVFLLQRPLRMAGGNWLHYQLLSTGLQCLWICGVWSLLASLATSEPRRRQILAFLIFSGFLFFNSVYTWPKLFAASLMLFALSILIGSMRERRPVATVELYAGSCSLGLALLAHPGSVFSLPAFGVLAIRNRKLVSGRQLAMAASIVLCLVLPWSAYQRWFDPPGDRLLKMHLAGEPAPTPRPTWQVMREAYRKHTAEEILRFKFSNLALLLGRSPRDLVGVDAVKVRPEIHIDQINAEHSRAAQGEYIWNALGVLNAGWAVVLVLVLRRRVKSAVPFGGWLIVAALVNLTVWSLVMFGPGATVTTHSSYADILLLSIGLLGWILTLPRYAIAALFLVQLFNFVVVWVWPR